MLLFNGGPVLANASQGPTVHHHTLISPWWGNRSTRRKPPGAESGAERVNLLLPPQPVPWVSEITSYTQAGNRTRDLRIARRACSPLRYGGTYRVLERGKFYSQANPTGNTFQTKPRNQR